MHQRSDIFAFVPLVTLAVVTAGLFMINSCDDEKKELKILEPITIIQPDSVVVSIKKSEPLPLEIKFVTDRPILYALGLYSIDSTKSGQFDPMGADTIFRLYDSIPRENKKHYIGTFEAKNTKAGHKVRVKIAMQALGNSGQPEKSHYFEKFLRFDVIK
ncbi:MAG: hypothetical protein RMJ53_06375 [Chitinophagales bacterium]|nr:hypothetical protein [Chitinophagales bacterium]